jgi:ABC-2 type transport system permease protein
MTVATARPGRGAWIGWVEVVALSRRAVIRMARQPSAWLPGLLVPLLVAAVFTGDYTKVATAIGFPASASYLHYVLPAALLAGAVYVGIVAGTESTLDVENGFISRLLLATTWRPAILVGSLAVAALQAIVQSCVLLAVFAAFGAGIHGGVAGGVVIVVATALFAVAVAGVAIALGLWTGDSEVMQSLFGVLFILLFISSAFFPPADMNGWFRAAATHDPITMLANGMRDPVLGHQGGHGPAEALGVAAICCVVGILLALGALRGRDRAGAK